MKKENETIAGFGELVRIGFEPYSPNASVDSWEPWMYYDGPLNGVFKSHKMDVVFSVFDIRDTPFTKWTYVVVDDPDDLENVNFETMNEFGEFFNDMVEKYGIAGTALARSEDFVIVAVATDPELLNYDKGRHSLEKIV